MAEEPFRLIYDGPILRDGKMDARELSQALLALGDTVARANLLLNGERSTVTLQISASSEPGSFPAILELWQQVHDALFSDQVVPPQIILEHLGLAGAAAASEPGIVANLIELWKLLRGERPKVVEESNEAGVAIIDVDGEHNKVSQTVLNLYGDREIHLHFPGVFAPLRLPGVDEWRSEYEGQVVERVDEGEVEMFRRGDWLTEGVEPEEREDEVRAEIITAQFREGYKWRFFSSLLGRFTADMKDEEFLDRLARREDHFGYGDWLRFLMRTKVTIESDGPTVEREITKVLEVIHSSRQDSLKYPR